MKLKTFENKHKQNIYKFILQIIMVSVSAGIAGLAFKNFFESAGIIPTGLSGLSMIIRDLLISIGVNLPTAVIYLIFNLLLFIFAFKIFGWRFLVLSGFGIGFYTLAMQFGSIPAIANNPEIDLLLYAVVGAVVGGLCVGVAMKNGGTTGGSDIMAVIINRYFPKIKTGYCILLINAVVLTLSVITSGLQTGLYALVVAVVNSLTTNLVLDGSKRVVSYYIICDKDIEIAEAILDKYHRGVTKLNAQGMFSHKNKALLLCVIPHSQTADFKSMIKKLDENAFVFSAQVNETLGDGNFLKEYSIFKNKIKSSKKSLKNKKKYKRIENIKKLKLKKKEKTYKKIRN